MKKKVTQTFGIDFKYFGVSKNYFEVKKKTAFSLKLSLKLEKITIIKQLLTLFTDFSELLSNIELVPWLGLYALFWIIVLPNWFFGFGFLQFSGL